MKTIKKGDYMLVEDDDVFVEANWKEKEIIAEYCFKKLDK